MEKAESKSQNQENNGTATSHHVINISEKVRQWLPAVQERMKQKPMLLNMSAGKESCCIFRVPQSLVEINPRAYQPHIVSIGPYHCGNERLQMIQEHKWRFLDAALARTQSHGISLCHFFETIASKEAQIREYYSETVKCGSRELVEMMVLDGCFIIELFCIVNRLVNTDSNDPLFKTPWIFDFLMRDLLMLENQIPFFVLQSLFDLPILYSRQGKPTLIRLALEFFNYAVQKPPELLDSDEKLNGNHLLDLFRKTYVASITEVKRERGPFLELIQSAKKLHVAGIQLKPRETARFLDIKFSHGVLEIPPLTVDDLNSPFLLNCVAFEQCYDYCSKHMTSYVTFMGCLITSPIDAGYLGDHKIIENYFGTAEEVAEFFNRLGKDVHFDIQMSYLGKVFEDVNEYYRNNWHVRWAGFKHTYFDTPWSFMSALAALILLILTMIQAFFAAYQCFRPAPSPRSH